MRAQLDGADELDEDRLRNLSGWHDGRHCPQFPANGATPSCLHVSGQEFMRVRLAAYPALALASRCARLFSVKNPTLSKELTPYDGGAIWEYQIVWGQATIAASIPNGIHQLQAKDSVGLRPHKSPHTFWYSPCGAWWLPSVLRDDVDGNLHDGVIDVEDDEDIAAAQTIEAGGEVHRSTRTLQQSRRGRVRSPSLSVPTGRWRRRWRRGRCSDRDGSRRGRCTSRSDSTGCSRGRGRRRPSTWGSKCRASRWCPGRWKRHGRKRSGPR